MKEPLVVAETHERIPSLSAKKGAPCDGSAYRQQATPIEKSDASSNGEDAHERRTTEVLKKDAVVEMLGYHLTLPLSG